MCYNPITVINPSKYVSLHYRDRFLLQVPCGHCAQCVTNKSNEWYFRAYHQSLDTLSNGGYILFDTLTYRNEDLPHLSDFVSVPDGCDYPCFSSRHIQLFNKRLRKRCSKYGSRYTFFLTSEYGTSPGRSHRPHYHILVYCDGLIPPLVLSSYIAECWLYGRTDGVPYRINSYVMTNVFTSENFANSLRTCRYVSKYIQKSCRFTKTLNARLDAIMRNIASRMIDGWLDSTHAKRVRMRYVRLMGQFHRQSKEFGASYMRDIDITDFSSFDEVSMPDSKKVHLKIPLPMYYRRKFFYDVVKIDGNDTWILNDLGQKYMQYRDKSIRENLVKRYTAANHQFKRDYNVQALANYVLDYRGRIRSNNIPESSLDKYNRPTYFCYVTLSDREHLENLGLSSHFIGNNTIGYRVSKLPNRIRLRDFIGKYVILDDKLEAQLDDIAKCYSSISDKRQQGYELREHLSNLYRKLGII